MSGFGQIAQSKLKLKALVFDGTNERMSMGNQTEYQFERTNAFSLSCWFKTSATTFQVLMGKTQGSVLNANIRGYDTYVAPNGKLGFNRNSNFEANEAANNYAEIQTTTGGYNDGKWHHFVATCAGGNAASTMKIYVDGVLATTQINHDDLTGTILNAQALVAGDQTVFLAAPFNGQMQEWSVWNKELNATEVASLYANHSPPNLSGANFSGLAANLKGYWKPSLTNVNPTITDHSTAAHNATMLNMEAGDIVSR